MLFLALGMFAAEEPGGFSTILAVAQRDLLNVLMLGVTRERRVTVIVGCTPLFDSAPPIMHSTRPQQLRDSGRRREAELVQVHPECAAPAPSCEVWPR